VREIRDGVTGSNPDIDRAIEWLKSANRIVIELADGPGKANRHHLAGGHRA